MTCQHDRAEIERYSSPMESVASPDSVPYGRSKHLSAWNKVLFGEGGNHSEDQKYHAQVVEVKVYYSDCHNSTLDPMPIRFLVL